MGVDIVGSGSFTEVMEIAARGMRRVLVGVLLVVVPALARAEGSRAGVGEATAPAGFTSSDGEGSSWDPASDRREALFDIAVAALVHGDLDLSERAFLDAAAVKGDPVRTAVASAFAERVRRLRVLRLRRQTFMPTEAASAAARARPAPRETSQRATVLGVTGLLGLALYGWTLPVALGVSVDESPRSALLLYMFTGAGALVAPYLFTRNRPVSAAQANLAFYGGSRGIWHGVMAGAILAGDLTPNGRTRGWAASMLLGSAAELAGGYLLAERTRMTAGQARTMAALGDFGLLGGVGVGYMLRFPDRATADQQARAMGASTLLGSALGLTGGYFLGRRRDSSWGDAEVMRMAGFVGGVIGFGAADLFELDLDLRDRRVTGLALAGTALGVAAGDWLTRTTEFSVSQSILVDLATVAGALVATGVAYVVAPQADDGRIDPPVALAAAIGGATASSPRLLDPGRCSRARPAARGRRRRREPARQVSVLPTVGGRGERGLAVVGRF